MGTREIIKYKNLKKEERTMIEDKLINGKVRRVLEICEPIINKYK